LTTCSGAGQFSVATRQKEDIPEEQWMYELEQAAKKQWVKLMGKL